MGAMYMNGRVACDRCGRTGGVRKVCCPFGNCPSIRASAACRTEKREKWAEYHVSAGCAEQMAEQRTLAATRPAAIGDAALYSGAAQARGETVVVHFRSASGDVRVGAVSAAEYDARTIFKGQRVSRTWTDFPGIVEVNP